ncbi:MAG: dTDP-4-dehydrorhamnose 3,5-epimerase [Cytophagaceae bacterium]|nr:dTDP-4-dehydrorhamnose 3,5-epimerase [Cytophagaceae bacterium]MDW8456908.1 dTDP-4-dehydrorhamnose 3,5-epimerase [Cytophagaceae bacterium]
MQVFKTPIYGVLEIIPDVYEDKRGYFFESYNETSFDKIGIHTKFLQDNQSYSYAGVLRGLHFQKPPYAQAKLVRVIKGKVLDVVVDLRKNSPTFKHHLKIILDSNKQNMLFIPEGLAHGFLALEDSIVSYKCSNVYNKSSESGLIWHDSEINIDWGIKNPIISEKDQHLKTFSELIQHKEI